MSNPNPKNQWQPGTSGNPYNRTSLLKILKDELAKTKTPKGKTKAELLMEKLLDLAISGNLKAIQEIINRTEGTNVQLIKMEQDITQHEEIDLTNLTDEQLKELKSLTELAQKEPNVNS